MNCWLGEGGVAIERMVRQSPVCTYCLAKSLAEQYSRQQMKQAKLRSDLLQGRERKMSIVWVGLRRAAQKTSKCPLNLVDTLLLLITSVVHGHSALVIHKRYHQRMVALILTLSLPFLPHHHWKNDQLKLQI